MSQGLTFKKLALRNFCSFGNQWAEIDLSITGTIHITGENLDAGGASGAGKTTIFNALTFTLFDKPISNISKEKLINRTNSKKDTQMEVKLWFEKDGVEYEIHRWRGEQYGIKIFMDGEDKTPDSVSNCNQRIQDIIGISFELFTRVVIFLGSDKGFLEMPVSQQRSQIEELFKITILSEKATILKVKIKEAEREVSIKEAEIKAAITARDLREKHITDAEARISKWEADKEKKIEDIGTQLGSVAGIDFDTELMIAKELSALESNISIDRQTLKSTVTDITKLKKDCGDLSKQIEHLAEGTCPFCKQDYQDEKKLDEIVLKLEDKQGLQFDYEANAAKLSDRIVKLDAHITETKAKQKVDDIDKLDNIRLNTSKLETQMMQLETEINPHIEPLEALLAEQDVVIDHTEIDVLKKEILHQTFLLKLLTDKSSFIRKTILNKNIPLLNQKLQYYTKELGLPHIIQFTSDMDCQISEYGRELDFGNLSGGEKVRVNISLSLAFRDVMKYLHYPVNLLGADEIDAGSMDSASMDAIIRLLKAKSRNEEIGIFCISHRTEMLNRLDRELLIRKERGFSSMQFINEGEE